MKNILFPTDFSESANNAFIYALRVAHKLGAGITTLHAYNVPDIRGVSLPSTMEEVYNSINLEEFHNYKDHVPLLKELAKKEGLSKLPLKHVMKEGDTVDLIIHEARNINADLIIMGTWGASGLKELFFGSIAGEVLENADCPVLTIPVDAIFDGRIDRIAITTEYAENEKMALDKIIKFAKNFDATVTCINVDTAHVEFYLKRMDKLREEYAHLDNVSFEVLEGLDMRKTVSDFLEENKIDILAMLTHKRNFFQELFSFSRTKKMAYSSHTPILGIQAHTLK